MRKEKELTDPKLWMVKWQIENGEKGIEKAIDSEIERAEYLVEQLKSRKNYMNEIRNAEDTKDTRCTTKIDDILKWGMNDINNYIQNVKLQSIMEMLGDYKAAKAIKDFSEGKV